MPSYYFVPRPGTTFLPLTYTELRRRRYKTRRAALNAAMKLEREKGGSYVIRMHKKRARATPEQETTNGRDIVQAARDHIAQWEALAGTTPYSTSVLYAKTIVRQADELDRLRAVLASARADALEAAVKAVRPLVLSDREIGEIDGTIRVIAAEEMKDAAIAAIRSLKEPQ